MPDPAPRLPTFLVIGAQKAGTTALHQYLRAHPDVFMSRPKELRFFVAGANWDRGPGWYADHFAGAGDRAAVGESSPDYARATVHPGVPERITALLPEVRLVYLVRHPLDRIRSAYQHALAHGAERRAIGQAVLAEPHYVDDSRYAFQLSRYLDHLDRDRLLVVDSDDLRHRRSDTLARVATFLGLDPHRFRWSRVERDVYTSEGRTVPHRAVAVAGRSGWMTPLRRVVPASWRTRVRSRTSRPVRPDELVLAPEVVEALWSRLADDVAELVPWVPGAAHWGPGARDG